MVFLKTVKGELCWTVNKYAVGSQIVELHDCVYDASQEFLLRGDKIWVSGGVSRSKGYCVKFEPGKVVYTRKCY